MEMEKVTVYAEKYEMHTFGKYANTAAIAYSHKTGMPSYPMYPCLLARIYNWIADCLLGIMITLRVLICSAHNHICHCCLVIDVTCYRVKVLVKCFSTQLLINCSCLNWITSVLNILTTNQYQ